MGTILIAGLALACCPTMMLGQVASPADTPPADPLIAPTAPAYSQWTVACVYAGTNVTPGKGAGAPAKDTRLKQETITKTADVKQDVSVFEDGSQSEKWTRGSILATKDPGYSGVSIHVVQQTGPFADFPEFDWVSRGHYIGKQKVDSQDCLLFEEQEYAFRFVNLSLFKAITSTPDGSPTSNIGNKVPVIAIIDEKTRLPIQLKIGKDVRTFSYLPAPTTPLTLPPDFAVAVGKAAQDIQGLIKPLSRP